MAIIPIIIPIENNCIIQAGRKFCESGGVTWRELGVALLCAVFWAIVIGWLLLEKDNPIVAAMVFISPLIAMIIFGGSK